MDVSNFGTTFTSTVYTSKIQHDNGDLLMNAATGKILVDGFNGIDIGSFGKTTTIKGDLAIDGAFTFKNFGDISSDRIETKALTVNGDSVMQGSIDLNGDLNATGTIALGSADNDTSIRGGLLVVGGNIHIESDRSLLDSASTQYIMLGDGNVGSWRIGVSNDNRLNFQRHNEFGWATVSQIGI